MTDSERWALLGYTKCMQKIILLQRSCIICLLSYEISVFFMLSLPSFSITLPLLLRKLKLCQKTFITLRIYFLKVKNVLAGFQIPLLFRKLKSCHTRFKPWGYISSRFETFWHDFNFRNKTEFNILFPSEMNYVFVIFSKTVPCIWYFESFFKVWTIFGIRFFCIMVHSTALFQR